MKQLFRKVFIKWVVFEETFLLSLNSKWDNNQSFHTSSQPKSSGIGINNPDEKKGLRPFFPIGFFYLTLLLNFFIWFFNLIFLRTSSLELISPSTPKVKNFPFQQRVDCWGIWAFFIPVDRTVSANRRREVHRPEGQVILETRREETNEVNTNMILYL